MRGGNRGEMPDEGGRGGEGRGMRGGDCGQRDEVRGLCGRDEGRGLWGRDEGRGLWGKRYGEGCSGG